MSDIMTILQKIHGGDEAHNEAETPSAAEDNHIGQDPHFWLDPVLAEKEVILISEAIIEIDPTNAAFYTQNTSEYLKQLDKLDQDYKSTLSTCKSNEIVTNHAAFGYLAAQYNLKQIPIAGISPESEPSAQHLVDLTKIIKEKQIKYIYFENLVSSKFADTLANEVGVKTLMLHHVGSLTPDELAANKNYISLMRDNLANLKIGLECK